MEQIQVILTQRIMNQQGTKLKFKKLMRIQQLKKSKITLDFNDYRK